MWKLRMGILVFGYDYYINYIFVKVIKVVSLLRWIFGLINFELVLIVYKI